MRYHADTDKDINSLTNFLRQLETLIEGGDAYNSNVHVLSFEIINNGDITGKFEDAWNGRIFSYSVQKDRIGYKPALTLDRADNATAKLFDIFSSGYTSLGVRKDAIKDGKKPRCTAVSYSCGKICLSLQNTCWINSGGQKIKKIGGSEASISQERIDKLRMLATDLAANGNKKWSKYGRAENLTTKANTLEEKQTILIKSGIKTELPVQTKIVKTATPNPVINKPNSKSSTRKTSEKTNINNTHDVLPLRKNVNELILVDKIASLTGMKTKEARSSLYAVSNFTSTHYTYYRETERTGKPMPNASDKSIAVMTQQVKDVNRYLDKMPKFDGSVYRGLTFDSQQVVDDFVKKLQDGNSYQIDAMSSFSSSIDVAKKFATPNSQAEMPSVAFKVLKNKSGVTVKGVSSLPEEDEVLIPKGARYKIAGNIEILEHKGKKITIIPLEEY